MALPCLNYYYDLFYKDKVKIVPKNLGELFTAKGLAEGRRYISTTSALFSKSSATLALNNKNTEVEKIKSSATLALNNKNTEVEKIYSNADKDKVFIYKDNRKKCGVYC